MAPLTHFFASTAALEQGFADGLAAMLEAHRGLGVYILVLANAAYDKTLWAQLAPALAARHGELATAVTETLRGGKKLTEPDDDVLVFLKLNTIGLEHLGAMEGRRAGAWDVMFNPIRALRPPRISGQKFEGLLRHFDPAGFHFNKPFLAREVLWEGELAGKPARLLYNKFPFARLHGLLVPEPLRETPQYLTPELHGWAWEVCAQSGVPGLCLGYNSYGAGASVNHLHFQSFVQANPLPVQDTRFVHNGGAEPYALPCQRFTEPVEAWLELDRLHQENTPYNLIYSRDCLHLVTRVPQDSDKLSTQSRGYGWSEMAGALTVFSREAYEGLGTTEFEAELATFAPQARPT
jgi:ATP adenylyltransferase/5',5'''-P-1,P-4-tetraphosphate phosphorylase II